MALLLLHVLRQPAWRALLLCVTAPLPVSLHPSRPARPPPAALPKVAQALLLAPEAVSAVPGQAPPGVPGGVTAVQELLLDRYPIIREIYKHLGWGVVDERQRPVVGSRLLYSCVAPPLTPWLWQVGQAAVLGVKPLPLQQRDRLVYCGRTGKGRIENAGRQVLNEDELLPELERLVAAPHGLTLEYFDHRDHPTLPDLIAYFSRARALVGPHGGCLTNVVFMGCGSSVLEVYPLVGGVRTPVGHPAYMMYLQASFMEQDYSMLPVHTPDEAGSAAVPVGDVISLLDASLRRTGALYGLPPPRPPSPAPTPSVTATPSQTPSITPTASMSGSASRTAVPTPSQAPSSPVAPPPQPAQPLPHPQWGAVDASAAQQVPPALRK